MYSFDMLYTGIFVLDDGSEHEVDFESRWADKDKLARLRRFVLVPKDEANNSMPLVALNLPEGAKLIFKHRVFGQFGTGDALPHQKFRIYCVGYKFKGDEHLFWIMPNGVIEFGVDLDDPEFALAVQQNAPLADGNYDIIEGTAEDISEAV